MGSHEKLHYINQVRASLCPALSPQSEVSIRGTQQICSYKYLFISNLQLASKKYEQINLHFVIFFHNYCNLLKLLLAYIVQIFKYNTFRYKYKCLFISIDQFTFSDRFYPKIQILWKILKLLMFEENFGRNNKVYAKYIKHIFKTHISSVNNNI